MIKQKNEIKGFALYVELASLGLEMFAPIALGACSDSFWSTKPFGVIFGIMIGVIFVSLHVKKRLF